jgi:hypothetical protein
MKTTSLHVMIAVVLALTSRVTGTIDSTVPADGSLLLLTSPAAGHVLYAGDTMDVRWLTNDTAVHLACLRLLWEWQESPYWITDGCLEPGMEAWEHVRRPIPASFPAPRICRIEYDNYLGDVRDTSAPFAILPPVPANERDTTLPANGLFLEVLSPGDGEHFYCGDTMHIRWRCVDKLMTAVLGEISFDEGRSFSNLAPVQNVIGSPGEEGWEHFHWVIPDSMLSSTHEPVPLNTDKAVVRIYDYDQTIADISGVFTIRPRDYDHTLPGNGEALEVLSPKGGDLFRVGDTMRIRWAAVDSLVCCVDLYLSNPRGGRFRIPPDHCMEPGANGWEERAWVISDTIESANGDGERVPAADDEWTLIVEDYCDGHAESDGFFTIVPAAAIARTAVTSSSDGGLRVGSVSANRIAVTVGHDGPHAVALYRLNGTRVTHRGGTGPAGYTIDKRGLSTGVYFIRITAAGTTLTRHVTIAR